MGRVISLVQGEVAAEKLAALVDAYRTETTKGLPPPIEQSFLTSSSTGHVEILTVWRSREDLELMIASGREPFARRLIREAGGSPVATFHDVLASA